MTAPISPIGDSDVSDPQRRDLTDPLAKTRDPGRLTALKRLALLDTPAEQAFDRLSRLAAKILHAPVALLTLVDGDRAFFKSSVGLPELWAKRREMPLAHSVCQYVVASNAPVVIDDARAHPLVTDNKAVADLKIVAYMGIPLTTSEEHTLGSFAVIDTVPRSWSPDDVTILKDLAASAMTEIELRAETNQRKQAEDRLVLLESAVVNANDAVLILEADPAEPSAPRIVFVNEVYSRLTGYSQEELVGKTHQLLAGSETEQTQIDTILTALATWKPARLKFLSHRKDGSAFWAESKIIPIADKAGRYSHWVVVQRDISEQKAAAESLRKSEARRQAVMDSALDCIITLDDQERVTEFNLAAERTFGYSVAEAIGKPLVELITPPLPGDSRCLGLVQAFTSKENSLFGKRLEMMAVRADGTKFPAELAFGTLDLEGPVFTTFLRDISERKQAERFLTTQYVCTRIISATTVMDDTIQKVLQAVCENMGWSLGQMWQLDSKAGLLRCVAVWHKPSPGLIAFADLSRKTTFHIGDGLPGQVWSSCETIWVKDLEKDATFTRTEAATQCSLQSAFAFPIFQGAEVIGVMEFLHDIIPEPDFLLLDMIASVSSQIGQFLQRVQTDLALRHNEARYRSLVEAGSHIVWITDVDGQLLLEDSAVWESWRNFTGQNLEQAKGSGWLDAVHPDDRAQTAEIWEEAIAKNKLYHCEYRLRTASGEYRHTVSRGVSVQHSDGLDREWVGTTTDITEQKMAEEALRISEAEMRGLALIVQSTDNAVTLTDPEGRIEWINDGFTRICEYKLEEVVGKRPGTVLQGPDTNPTTVEHMHERLAQGRGFQVEILNYAKSGRSYWLAIEVQPIHDDQGNLIRFMAISSDITARKRTEKLLQDAYQVLEVRVAQRTAELSETNEFLKALLDNIQDGIVACNSEGNITLLNRTIRELHGLPDIPNHPSQWAHQFDLFHLDGLTPLTAEEVPLARALRGERVQNLEFVVASKFGGPRTVTASGRAVYDGRGNRLGAVVSVTDITERKRYEMEALKAHEELERRVKSRTAELRLPRTPQKPPIAPKANSSRV